VIVLDTHVWIWWVDQNPRLAVTHRQAIEDQGAGGIGVSAITCWEVAKLVSLSRITLTLPVDEWLDQALAYPGVQFIGLTPRIAIESTRLPGQFHRDPADQIIVATARVFDCELVTEDQRILDYPHVQTVGPR
jgi:PIN domain nuclease of toxin-antitoxin system